MPTNDDHQTVTPNISPHGDQSITDAAGGEQMLPDRKAGQSKTVSTKPRQRAPLASPEAQEDGSRLSTPSDQRWIETVLASLRTRPRATREALAKALLDGDGSENSHFSSPNLSAPVGCTKLTKSLKTEHLTDAREANCSTTVSHKDHAAHGPTPCSGANSSSIVGVTTVGGRGTRPSHQAV